MQSAEPQLLALARAMRPEWDHAILAAAILAAKQAGWTWSRTFTMTARMLIDDNASPWDLKHAAANPLRREPPQPGTTERGAALARELLSERTA